MVIINKSNVFNTSFVCSEIALKPFENLFCLNQVFGDRLRRITLKIFTVYRRDNELSKSVGFFSQYRSSITLTDQLKNKNIKIFINQ